MLNTVLIAPINCVDIKIFFYYLMKKIKGHFNDLHKLFL